MRDARRHPLVTVEALFPPRDSASFRRVCYAVIAGGLGCRGSDSGFHLGIIATLVAPSRVRNERSRTMQDPSLVRGGRTAGVVRSWVSGLVGGARVPARGCASHLWLMGHFSGWLAAGKLDGSAVTPAVADDFLARRRGRAMSNSGHDGDWGITGRQNQRGVNSVLRSVGGGGCVSGYITSLRTRNSFR